jgi:hypothetical protein
LETGILVRRPPVLCADLYGGRKPIFRVSFYCRTYFEVFSNKIRDFQKCFKNAGF